MAIIDKIKAKAMSDVKHIVLPEGEETRNIQAAAKIAEAGIAKITMLGDPAKVAEVAATTNTDLSKVEIIDPKHHDIVNSYSVNNVVISNRYISKMVAQIGEVDALFDFYEDVLSYALFPQVASKFLAERNNPKPVEAPKAEVKADPNAVREFFVQDLSC